MRQDACSFNAQPHSLRTRSCRSAQQQKSNSTTTGALSLPRLPAPSALVMSCCPGVRTLLSPVRASGARRHRAASHCSASASSEIDQIPPFEQPGARRAAPATSVTDLLLAQPAAVAWFLRWASLTPCTAVTARWRWRLLRPATPPSCSPSRASPKCSGAQPRAAQTPAAAHAASRRWEPRLPVAAPCDRARILASWSADARPGAAPLRERALPFAAIRTLRRVALRLHEHTCADCVRSPLQPGSVRGAASASGRVRSGRRAELPVRLSSFWGLSCAGCVMRTARPALHRG